jgi:hypothetical protein
MRKSYLAIGLLLAATLFSAPAEAARGCEGGPGNSLVILGLTSDQRLICFEERNPSDTVIIGQISGLTGDVRLVGIDFRPATGKLYGLGNAGGLYVIDTGDASATFQAQLNVALTGNAFDIDFNPTVDRLRIVSDTGQNLRANVADGAVTTDTALTNPDPATGIAGAAYTNNDANGNTGTTLYIIDSRSDQLLIQAPPNAGSLNATGRLTFDATSDVGFDIYSTIKGGNTIGAHAFASLVTNGRSRLYMIDLFTGQAWPRGTFRTQVIDIAIPLRQKLSRGSDGED